MRLAPGEDAYSLPAMSVLLCSCDERLSSSIISIFPYHGFSLVGLLFSLVDEEYCSFLLFATHVSDHRNLRY